MKDNWNTRQHDSLTSPRRTISRVTSLQRHTLTHHSPLTTHLFFCALFFLCIGCASLEKDVPPGKDLAIRWELITNLTDQPNVFEARFTIINSSQSDLQGQNWALFFNMAPRPILE